MESHNACSAVSPFRFLYTTVMLEIGNGDLRNHVPVIGGGTLFKHVSPILRKATLKFRFGWIIQSDEYLSIPKKIARGPPFARLGEEILIRNV